MSIENVDTDPYDFATTETLSADSTSVSGQSDSDLDVWSLDRAAKADKLLSAPLTGNESAYQIPLGMFGVGGYDNTTSDSEHPLGTHITGSANGPDGPPIAGSITLTSDGEVISTQGVDGGFIVSFAPPESVLFGPDGSAPQIPTYDINFSPKIDGLGVSQSGIKYPSGGTFSASYARVSGKVTDANGFAVSGESVTSSGFSTTSGPDGSYQVVAPDGRAVSLTSLGGTTEKSTTVSSGQENTIDFQYAGLDVTVELPGGVPGKEILAELSINGRAEVTDDNGTASFRRVPPESTGVVTVFGGIELDVASLSGGQVASETIQPGAGFTGAVRDGRTGARVKGVDVAVVGDDFDLSGSNPGDGRYYAAAEVAGKLKLSVARDDNRFNTVEVDRDVPPGETVEEDIELTRKDNIGNAI